VRAATFWASAKSARLILTVAEPSPPSTAACFARSSTKSHCSPWLTHSRSGSCGVSHFLWQALTYSRSWCDARILGFTCPASRRRQAAFALSAALAGCEPASAYVLGSDYADAGALAMGAPWATVRTKNFHLSYGQAASPTHGEVNAHRRTHQILPAYELRR
jgi:hypothetical protein